ncbi:MAG: hypothetical protein ABIK48_03605 [candidate division WOR-3 bacterium]
MFITMIFSLISARDLIYNGNFELPPDSGWQIIRWGEFPDTGNCRVRWRHSYHPDRDFEVMLHKLLHQGIKLFQKVSISTLDLEFRVSCRLTAKSESDSLFAAAAVEMEYLDNNDSILGETRIVYATAGCNWQNSPTLHLIRVPDTVNWYDYHINISSELESLPGIQRSEIKSIKVTLLGFVSGNS